MAIIVVLVVVVVAAAAAADVVVEVAADAVGGFRLLVAVVGSFGSSCWMFAHQSKLEDGLLTSSSNHEE